MPEKPKRGRPVSGRKIVVQIGLDEDVYETLVELAEADADETVSSKGRKLLTEAIQRERKRK